ncbi:MAG: hypothetical protein HQL17_01275 [Candidatus Omnitrophica bacterium]|nr:hypothetical protein [Candidatus Omnitrophota bacterium]
MIQKLFKFPLFKAIAIAVIVAFVSMIPAQSGYAQMLPKPGQMVPTSERFMPPLMMGLRVDVKDPFNFSFVMSNGQAALAPDAKKDEYNKLIKYFMASLITPNRDMWVNLSPKESNRIIPDNFGLTEMGRDLLAQDYLLKQFTASLMYPAGKVGRKFWDEVYKRAQDQFGTSEIPIDTFNKVWITADKADIYQKDDTALLVSSHLKVMLEQDFMAVEANKEQFSSMTEDHGDAASRQLVSDIVRQVIVPVIEKEVNEGANFAQVRQVYNSMILATWFKKTLKDSLLGQVYVDKDKVAGIAVDDPQAKDRIYAQYLEAYRQGVFNYIKEETDDATQEKVERKYFSGGMVAVGENVITMVDAAQAAKVMPMIAPMLDMASVTMKTSQDVDFKVDEKKRTPAASKVDYKSRKTDFEKLKAMQDATLLKRKMVKAWIDVNQEKLEASRLKVAQLKEEKAIAEAKVKAAAEPVVAAKEAEVEAEVAIEPEVNEAVSKLYYEILRTIDIQALMNNKKMLKADAEKYARRYARQQAENAVWRQNNEGVSQEVPLGKSGTIFQSLTALFKSKLDLDVDKYAPIAVLADPVESGTAGKKWGFGGAWKSMVAAAALMFQLLPIVANATTTAYNATHFNPPAPIVQMASQPAVKAVVAPAVKAEFPGFEKVGDRVQGQIWFAGKLQSISSDTLGLFGNIDDQDPDLFKDVTAKNGKVLLAIVDDGKIVKRYEDLKLPEGSTFVQAKASEEKVDANAIKPPEVRKFTSDVFTSSAIEQAVAKNNGKIEAAGGGDFISLVAARVIVPEPVTRQSNAAKAIFDVPQGIYLVFQNGGKLVVITPDKTKDQLPLVISEHTIDVKAAKDAKDTEADKVKAMAELLKGSLPQGHAVLFVSRDALQAQDFEGRMGDVLANAGEKFKLNTPKLVLADDQGPVAGKKAAEAVRRYLLKKQPVKSEAEDIAAKLAINKESMKEADENFPPAAGAATAEDEKKRSKTLKGSIFGFLSATADQVNFAPEAFKESWQAMDKKMVGSKSQGLVLQATLGFNGQSFTVNGGLANDKAPWVNLASSMLSTGIRGSIDPTTGAFILDQTAQFYNESRKQYSGAAENGYVVDSRLTAASLVMPIVDTENIKVGPAVTTVDGKTVVSPQKSYTAVRVGLVRAVGDTLNWVLLQIPYLEQLADHQSTPIWERVFTYVMGANEEAYGAKSWADPSPNELYSVQRGAAGEKLTGKLLSGDPTDTKVVMDENGKEMMADQFLFAYQHTFDSRGVKTYKVLHAMRFFSNDEEMVSSMKTRGLWLEPGEFYVMPNKYRDARLAAITAEVRSGKYNGNDVDAVSVDWFRGEVMKVYPKGTAVTRFKEQKVAGVTRLIDRDAPMMVENVPYSEEDFKGGFTVAGLVSALQHRGIDLPEGSAIEQINNNLLKDKNLYKRYSELTMTQDDNDLIAKIESLSENELMRFNRSLIDRGNPQQSPSMQQQRGWNGMQGAYGMVILSANRILQDTFSFTKTAPDKDVKGMTVKLSRVEKGGKVFYDIEESTVEFKKDDMKNALPLDNPVTIKAPAQEGDDELSQKGDNKLPADIKPRRDITLPKGLQVMTKEESGTVLKSFTVFIAKPDDITLALDVRGPATRRITKMKDLLAISSIAAGDQPLTTINAEDKQETPPVEKTRNARVVPVGAINEAGETPVAIIEGRNNTEYHDEIKESVFTVGDLNIEALRNSLKNNKKSDVLLLQKLATSTDALETVTGQDFIRVLNDILKMPKFYDEVKGSFDGKLLDIKIQPLLERVASADATLEDLARLNRALLEAIYPNEILKKAAYLVIGGDGILERYRDGAGPNGTFQLPVRGPVVDLEQLVNMRKAKNLGDLWKALKKEELPRSISIEDKVTVRLKREALDTARSKLETAGVKFAQELEARANAGADWLDKHKDIQQAGTEVVTKVGAQLNILESEKKSALYGQFGGWMSDDVLGTVDANGNIIVAGKIQEGVNTARGSMNNLGLFTGDAQVPLLVKKDGTLITPTTTTTTTTSTTLTSKPTTTLTSLYFMPEPVVKDGTPVAWTPAEQTAAIDLKINGENGIAAEIKKTDAGIAAYQALMKEGRGRNVLTSNDPNVKDNITNGLAYFNTNDNDPDPKAKPMGYIDRVKGRITFWSEQSTLASGDAVWQGYVQQEKALAESQLQVATRMRAQLEADQKAYQDGVLPKAPGLIFADKIKDLQAYRDTLTQSQTLLSQSLTTKAPDYTNMFLEKGKYTVTNPDGTKTVKEGYLILNAWENDDGNFKGTNPKGYADTQAGRTERDTKQYDYIKLAAGSGRLSAEGQALFIKYDDNIAREIKIRALVDTAITATDNLGKGGSLLNAATATRNIYAEEEAVLVERLAILNKIKALETSNTLFNTEISSAIALEKKNLAAAKDIVKARSGATSAEKKLYEELSTNLTGEQLRKLEANTALAATRKSIEDEKKGFEKAVEDAKAEYYRVSQEYNQKVLDRYNEFVKAITESGLSTPEQDEALQILNSMIDKLENITMDYALSKALILADGTKIKLDQMKVDLLMRSSGTMVQGGTSGEAWEASFGPGSNTQTSWPNLFQTSNVTVGVATGSNTSSAEGQAINTYNTINADIFGETFVDTVTFSMINSTQSKELPNKVYETEKASYYLLSNSFVKAMVRTDENNKVLSKTDLGLTVQGMAQDGGDHIQVGAASGFIKHQFSMNTILLLELGAVSSSGERKGTLNLIDPYTGETVGTRPVNVDVSTQNTFTFGRLSLSQKLTDNITVALGVEAYRADGQITKDIPLQLRLTKLAGIEELSADLTAGALTTSAMGSLKYKNMEIHGRAYADGQASFGATYTIAKTQYASISVGVDRTLGKRNAFSLNMGLPLSSIFNWKSDIEKEKQKGIFLKGFVALKVFPGEVGKYEGDQRPITMRLSGEELAKRFAILTRQGAVVWISEAESARLNKIKNEAFGTLKLPGLALMGISEAEFKELTLAGKLVPVMYLQNEAIEKSKISKVGLNGDAILDKLIKSDILESVSETEVRLKGDFNEDRIREIAGSDSDAIWRIIKPLIMKAYDAGLESETMVLLPGQYKIDGKIRDVKGITPVGVYTQKALAATKVFLDIRQALLDKKKVILNKNKDGWYAADLTNPVHKAAVAAGEVVVGRMMVQKPLPELKSIQAGQGVREGGLVWQEQFVTEAELVKAIAENRYSEKAIEGQKEKTGEIWTQDAYTREDAGLKNIGPELTRKNNMAKKGKLDVEQLAAAIKKATAKPEARIVLYETLAEMFKNGSIAPVITHTLEEFNEKNALVIVKDGKGNEVARYAAVAAIDKIPATLIKKPGLPQVGQGKVTERSVKMKTQILKKDIKGETVGQYVKMYKSGYKLWSTVEAVDPVTGEKAESETTKNQREYFLIIPKSATADAVYATPRQIRADLKAIVRQADQVVKLRQLKGGKPGDMETVAYAYLASRRILVKTDTGFDLKEYSKDQFLDPVAKAPVIKRITVNKTPVPMEVDGVVKKYRHETTSSLDRDGKGYKVVDDFYVPGTQQKAFKQTLSDDGTGWSREVYAYNLAELNAMRKMIDKNAAPITQLSKMQKDLIADNKPIMSISKFVSSNPDVAPIILNDSVTVEYNRQKSEVTVQITNRVLKKEVYLDGKDKLPTFQAQVWREVHRSMEWHGEDVPAVRQDGYLDRNLNFKADTEISGPEGASMYAGVASVIVGGVKFDYMKTEPVAEVQNQQQADVLAQGFAKLTKVGAAESALKLEIAPGWKLVRLVNLYSGNAIEEWRDQNDVVRGVISGKMVKGIFVEHQVTKKEYANGTWYAQRVPSSEKTYPVGENALLSESVTDRIDANGFIKSFLYNYKHQLQFEILQDARGRSVEQSLLEKGPKIERSVLGVMLHAENRKMLERTHSSYVGVPGKIDVPDSMKTYNGTAAEVKAGSARTISESWFIDAKGQIDPDLMNPNKLFSERGTMRYGGLEYHPRDTGVERQPFQDVLTGNGDTIEHHFGTMKDDKTNFQTVSSHYYLYDFGVGKLGRSRIASRTITVVNNAPGGAAITSFSNEAIPTLEGGLEFKVVKGFKPTVAVPADPEAVHGVLELNIEKLRFDQPQVGSTTVLDNRGRADKKKFGYEGMDAVGFPTGAAQFQTQFEYDEKIGSIPSGATTTWSKMNNDVVAKYGPPAISSNGGMVQVTMAVDSKLEPALKSATTTVDGREVSSHFEGLKDGKKVISNLYFNAFSLPSIMKTLDKDGKEVLKSVFRNSITMVNDNPHLLTEEFEYPSVSNGKPVLEKSNNQLLNYNGVPVYSVTDGQSRHAPYVSVLSPQDIVQNSVAGMGAAISTTLDQEFKSAIEGADNKNALPSVYPVLENNTRLSWIQDKISTVKDFGIQAAALLAGLSILNLLLLTKGLRRRLISTKVGEEPTWGKKVLRWALRYEPQETVHVNAMSQAHLSKLGFTTPEMNVIMEVRRNEGGFKSYEDLEPLILKDFERITSNDAPAIQARHKARQQRALELIRQSFNANKDVAKVDVTLGYLNDITGVTRTKELAEEPKENSSEFSAANFNPELFRTNLKQGRKIDQELAEEIVWLRGQRLSLNDLPEDELIAGLNKILRNREFYKSRSVMKYYVSLNSELEDTLLRARAADSKLTDLDYMRLNRGLLKAAYPDAVNGVVDLKGLVSSYKDNNWITDAEVNEILAKLNDIGTSVPPEMLPKLFRGMLARKALYDQNNNFMKKEVRKEIEDKVTSLFNNLGLVIGPNDSKEEFGSNAFLFDTIMKSIRGAGDYEYVDLPREKSPSGFYVLTNDDLESEADRNSGMRSRLVSLEQMVMMHALQLKMVAINGSGRVDEWMYQYIKRNPKLSNWHMDPDQGKEVFATINRFYKPFTLLLQKTIGKQGEEVKDRWGKYRYHVNSFLWEDVSQVFRYLLEQDETNIDSHGKLNISNPADKKVIDKMRVDLNTYLENVLAGKTKIKDTEDELISKFKMFEYTVQRSLGMVFKKNRMEHYQVMWMSFWKVVLDKKTRDGFVARDNPYIESAKDQVRKFNSRAMYWGSFGLGLYLGWNAIMQLGLLAVPAFVAVAPVVLGVAAVGLVLIDLVSWGVRKILTDKGNADQSVRVSYWANAAKVLALAGIVGAVLFAPATAVYAVPWFVRALFTVSLYKLVFETAVILIFAVKNLIQGFEVKDFYRQQDIYAVNAHKELPAALDRIFSNQVEGWYKKKTMGGEQIDIFRRSILRELSDQNDYQLLIPKDIITGETPWDDLLAEYERHQLTVIEKSELSEIASVNDSILNPAHENTVWDIVSDTGIRLKPNLTLDDSDLEKIAGKDFEKLLEVMKKAGYRTGADRQAGIAKIKALLDGQINEEDPKEDAKYAVSRDERYNRIIRWTNDRLRKDKPAPIRKIRDLHAYAISMQGFGEDMNYDWKDLGSSDRPTDVSTRLSQLARFKPEYFNALIERMKLGIVLPDNTVLRLKKADEDTLRALAVEMKPSERVELKLTDPKMEAYIIPWATTFLASLWNNANSSLKVRRPYEYIIENVVSDADLVEEYGNAEAGRRILLESKTDRIMMKHSGSSEQYEIAFMQDKNNGRVDQDVIKKLPDDIRAHIEALADKKLTLRDYIYYVVPLLRQAHLAGWVSRDDLELEVQRVVGIIQASNQYKTKFNAVIKKGLEGNIRLIILDGVTATWNRTNQDYIDQNLMTEQPHSMKWNSLTASLPFVHGLALDLVDADHHLRTEDGWNLPEAQREFFYDSRLGSALPIIDHYLATNIGPAGKVIPVGENAFYYHAHRGKDLMGGVTGYGKFMVRAKAMRWSEGLVGDDYVAEDSMTVIMFRNHGYTAGSVPYVRRGKHWFYQEINHTVSNYKWSSNAGGEAVSGRASNKLLTSPKVSSEFKVDNYVTDGFGFYMKKAFLPTYNKWLVVTFLILGNNLFAGVPMAVWLLGGLLSQAVSYGGLFNDVYDKHFGWFKGIMTFSWSIMKYMLWFFMNWIFTYEESAGKVAPNMLARFISSGGKGAALYKERAEDIFIRNQNAIRQGTFWSAIIFVAAPAIPSLWLFWAFNLLFFVAGWVGMFVVNPGKLMKGEPPVGFWPTIGHNLKFFFLRMKEIIPDIVKAGANGLIDAVKFTTARTPIWGIIERKMIDREVNILNTQRKLVGLVEKASESVFQVGIYGQFVSHFRRLFVATSDTMLKEAAALIRNNVSLGSFDALDPTKIDLIGALVEEGYIGPDGAIRAKFDKLGVSAEYFAGEFSGAFTIEKLVEALRSRGIDLPEVVGIADINKILTDSGLHEKYTEILSSSEDKEFVKNINKLSKSELMKFNRNLIDRGNLRQSPKSRFKNPSIIQQLWHRKEWNGKNEPYERMALPERWQDGVVQKKAFYLAGLDDNQVWQGLINAGYLTEDGVLSSTYIKMDADKLQESLVERLGRSEGDIKKILAIIQSAQEGRKKKIYDILKNASDTSKAKYGQAVKTMGAAIQQGRPEFFQGEFGKKYSVRGLVDALQEGPLEFSVGDFNNSLVDVQTVINKVVNDAGSKVPLAPSAKDAVKWLNESVEPFVIFSKIRQDNKLSDKVKDIEVFIESLNDETRELIKQENWTELVKTRGGQGLKRAILESLYPQTPKRRGRGIGIVVEKNDEDTLRNINEKVLTNRELYKKYSEVPRTADDLLRIEQIYTLNVNELKTFNRSLIERGNPKECPVNTIVVQNGDMKIAASSYAYIQDVPGEFNYVSDLVTRYDTALGRIDVLVGYGVLSESKAEEIRKLLWSKMAFPDFIGAEFNEEVAINALVKALQDRRITVAGVGKSALKDINDKVLTNIELYKAYENVIDLTAEDLLRIKTIDSLDQNELKWFNRSLIERGEGKLCPKNSNNGVLRPGYWAQKFPFVMRRVYEEAAWVLVQTDSLPYPIAPYPGVWAHIEARWAWNFFELGILFGFIDLWKKQKQEAAWDTENTTALKAEEPARVAAEAKRVAEAKAQQAQIAQPPTTQPIEDANFKEIDRAEAAKKDAAQLKAIAGALAVAEDRVQVLGSASKALGVMENHLQGKLDDAAKSVVETAVEEPATPGGISMSNAHLTINIKVDGDGMPLPVQFQDQAMVNIQGLLPVIRSIAPMSASNMPALSELIR